MHDAGINKENSFSLRQKCLTCDLRRNGFFCSFSKRSLKVFEGLKITKALIKGRSLFTQEQSPSGIYMLCQGRVKLSSYSRRGKAVITGVAVPGEVLGLGAAVSGLKHQTTAQAIEPCQVNFVRTEDLLRFLAEEPEAALNAARQLGREHQAAHRQISLLALSNSVGEKLARLLVEWARPKMNGEGVLRLRMTYKHEEIAEMIGTSRETVTRLLKEYRRDRLLTIEGSELYIHDLKRLKAIAGE